MARHLPHFLPDDQPERLCRAATRERDRLMLLLFLYCGLRVSEMARLTVPDLDFGRRLLWVRHGKGDKDRPVFLPRKLLGPLRGWVGGRQAGPVFPSRQGGGSLTARAIQLLFKRLAKRAGLPGALDHRRYHPHALRHSYACRLLESGATVYEVSRLLGHASIATTQVYLGCTDKRLAEAVDRL